MTAYYNEIDPFAAQWLRNLIDAGQIAPGEVDERSIEEVSADELRGFDQCHFFAGIGGWSLAARLAGIPDDYPLWTGSCPCQPFSSVGRHRGIEDERHLWPELYRLIRACRPSVVAGEQVSGKDGLQWLAAVRDDLEDASYAFGAADLPACSVGAPHLRRRLFWIADPGSERGAGQVSPTSACEARQGWPSGPEDMRAVRESPFVGRRGYPQPLLRRMDDGFSDAVAGLHAYGNAIVPQLAAEFLIASLEAIEAAA